MATDPNNPWNSDVQGDPNLVLGEIGPQQQRLNQLFMNSSQGLGPYLNSYAKGILPQPMQDLITATTNENFGHMGARFGTDLATAISRGLGQAGAQQSQWAMGDVLGLGGTTTGFEFQNTQNALNRALQEFLSQQQGDPMQALLMSLLGGG